MLLGLVRRTLTQAWPRVGAQDNKHHQKRFAQVDGTAPPPLDRQHAFAIVRWSNANIFSAYPREHILGKTDHQLSDAAGILPVVNPRQSWARAQPQSAGATVLISPRRRPAARPSTLGPFLRSRDGATLTARMAATRPGKPSLSRSWHDRCRRSV
jgi:hypothetical protein